MLGAILLNPPTGAGAASRRHLEVARRVLGFSEISIANLFIYPTQDAPAISGVGHHADGWDQARSGLSSTISDADGILVGWGLGGGLTGSSALLFREQVAWVTEELSAAGHEEVWMVGAEPRHPSRWHQFVSDRHGRTSGGNLETRIGEVLTLVAIEGLKRQPSPRA